MLNLGIYSPILAVILSNGGAVPTCNSSDIQKIYNQYPLKHSIYKELPYLRVEGAVAKFYERRDRAAPHQNEFPLSVIPDKNLSGFSMKAVRMRGEDMEKLHFLWQAFDPNGLIVKGVVQFDRAGSREICRFASR